ncbi:MAG: sulfotransferase [Gallionellaceae bacterium]|nr:sulfotransferase [Gallionellaceae bacterium]
MKPTFIGIGAQKCASSWLYDILADHPEVALSEKKELDFFSYHYENGYSWYESQFPNKASAKAVGEISPSYFNEASVPERVQLYSPGLRILLSLRDPVERALSQHRHMIRVGAVSGPDFGFETALADNPSYFDQGRYATHLSRWLACFPKDQVLVVLMDDIRKSPEGTARRVYEFLNIDPDHRSAALYEKSNPSYVVRYRRMDEAIRLVRKSTRQLGLGHIWKALGDSGLRRLYRGINRKSSEATIPPVPAEAIKKLKETFREEIKALEQLLGRDLESWHQS